ncbi:MAG: SH3 domain-containing protein [Paracoccaceae bacterium]|nr:SH3 domain-containing protein [Paracoccaceae bacterium]
MLKLSISTLVVVFMVLVIAGRDDGQASSRADVAVINAMDAPQVAQIAGDETDPLPSPTATPLQVVRMPGPALRPSPEYAQQAALTEAPPRASVWVVTANSLNVRSGPSTTNPVVDRISRGEEVLVVSDTRASWVKIRIEGDGIEGWVARKLLAPAN